MVHFSKDGIMLTFFRKPCILQDVCCEVESCDINFKRRYTKSSRQLNNTNLYFRDVWALAEKIAGGKHKRLLRKDDLDTYIASSLAGAA